MGQGALYKPVVQWWLSLNSSTPLPYQDITHRTRNRLTTPRQPVHHRGQALGPHCLGPAYR